MKYETTDRAYCGTPRIAGIIWEKGEDGRYKCSERGFTLEQWQIDSDVRNGYLKLIPPKH